MTILNDKETLALCYLLGYIGGEEYIRSEKVIQALVILATKLELNKELTRLREKYNYDNKDLFKEESNKEAN